MNRRGFIKTVTVAGFSVPLLSFGKPTPAPKGELEDFYVFCERQTVPMPWLPVNPMYQWQWRPFKLTEAQKHIAKIIHENRYVFVVKGRQVGFSTLTAAYSAWQWQRNPTGVNIYGASCNLGLISEWNKKCLRFAPAIEHSGHGNGCCILAASFWPKPEKFNIVTLDELNYEHTFEDFLDQLYQELEHGYTHDRPCPGKLIVGGSPDYNDRLHKATDNPKYRQFMVMHEPVTHFPELWSTTRLQDYFLAGGNGKELGL